MSDPVEFGYAFSAHIPRTRIERFWFAFDPRLADGYGIDLVSRRRSYPPACLRTSAEWLDEAIAAGKVDAEALLLVHSARNCTQNMRCPVFTRDLGWVSADTRLARSARPYYGLVRRRDGSFAALALDPAEPVPADVDAFMGGTPVLWDERVLPLEEVVSEAADPAHLWQVKRQVDPEYAELVELFEAHRLEPQAAAAEALLSAARRMGLERRRDGLHVCWGADRDGGVVLVVATAALEDVAAMARRAGAVHGLIVENGGSPQVALKRPGQPLRTLLESWFYRDLVLCQAIYQIDTQGSGFPIHGRDTSSSP